MSPALRIRNILAVIRRAVLQIVICRVWSALLISAGINICNYIIIMCVCHMHDCVCNNCKNIFLVIEHVHHRHRPN